MKATVTIIGRGVPEGTTRQVVVSEQDHKQVNGAQVKVNPHTNAPTILQLGNSNRRLATPLSFPQLLFGVSKIPNVKGWDNGIWNASRSNFNITSTTQQRIDVAAPNHEDLLQPELMSKAEQKQTFSRIANNEDVVPVNVITEQEEKELNIPSITPSTRISISFPNGVMLTGASAEIVNIPAQTLQALKDI